MKPTLLLIGGGLTAALLSAAPPEPPGQPVAKFTFPRVKGAGGVVPLPEAAQQPRVGAKIVLDVTAESEPQDVNKGLEKVARAVNLYASAGIEPDGVRIVAVFHGPAAKLALRDGEYARQTSVAKNPNRKLLRQLKDASVTLYVCGQSLADQGFAAGEVAPEVETAISAISVVVNCQDDGYAYVPVR